MEWLQRLRQRRWEDSDPLGLQPLKVRFMACKATCVHVCMDAYPWLLDEDESFAREKFGQQKAISSDEFFGRNNFDPQAQSEARTRLQGFDGATSISSNQYFGREEEEEHVDLTDMNNLEGTARELAHRLAGTAGEDLENLTMALGQGADKLQNALKQ